MKCKKKWGESGLERKKGRNFPILVTSLLPHQMQPPMLHIKGVFKRY